MSGFRVFLAVAAALPVVLAAARPATAATAAEVLANTPGAQGVFEAQRDGSIRHIQSGLVCPASFPNVTLSQAAVFPAEKPGDDVGCNYERLGPDGASVSRLAIYATRVAAGDTLEAMFAARQGEIAYSMPGAVPIGEAIPAALAPPPTPGSPDGMRSAQYFMQAGRESFVVDLIVAVQAGWQVKIRALYPATPPPPEDGSPAIANIDAPTPLAAWLKATEQVGKGRR